MPRPAKKPRTGPRAGSAILIWTTPEERRVLTDAAAREGQRLGPWLRALGMREAAVTPR